jgi:hypothetical protein
MGECEKRRVFQQYPAMKLSRIGPANQILTKMRRI